MNWQSDFVSPHLLQNDSPNPNNQSATHPYQINQQNTIHQQHPTSAAYAQNSTNYAQSRYASSHQIQPHFVSQYPTGQVHMMQQPTQHMQYGMNGTQVGKQQLVYASNNQHVNQASPVLDRNSGISSTNQGMNHNFQTPPLNTTNTSSSTHSYAPTFHSNQGAAVNRDSREGTNIQKQASTPNKSSASLLTTKIIESLRRNNLKVIAFDFDCTLVSIHTGGQWADSPEKLLEFVRPCFRQLIPALLKCPDLFVCVATYSPQEELIRQVLRLAMKDEYAVDDLVNKVIIKGNTREFVEEHGIENCYSNGKQIHLAFCRDFFESLIRKFNKETSSSGSTATASSTNLFKINSDNILLIDDDLQNLKIAYENGHLAFQVNNSIQLVDFYNFLDEI